MNLIKDPYNVTRLNIIIHFPRYPLYVTLLVLFSFMPAYKTPDCEIIWATEYQLRYNRMNEL